MIFKEISFNHLCVAITWQYLPSAMNTFSCSCLMIWHLCEVVWEPIGTHICTTWKCVGVWAPFWHWGTGSHWGINGRLNLPFIPWVDKSEIQIPKAPQNVQCDWASFILRGGLLDNASLCRLSSSVSFLYPSLLLSGITSQISYLYIMVCLSFWGGSNWEK